MTTKKVFGLTGNMGCGKSTVAQMLSKKKGVAVLNCDQISKSLFSVKENRIEIEKILEEKILVKGEVDFKRVAEIIFSDQKKKQKLEEFIHPKVWQKVCEIINANERDQLFIVESALIYRIGWEDRFDMIVNVDCSYVERKKRLIKTRKMNEKEIRERTKKEWSNKEAHFTVNTDCQMGKLAQKVDELYEELKYCKKFQLIGKIRATDDEDNSNTTEVYQEFGAKDDSSAIEKAREIINKNEKGYVKRTGLGGGWGEVRGSYRLNCIQSVWKEECLFGLPSIWKEEFPFGLPSQQKERGLHLTEKFRRKFRLKNL